MKMNQQIELILMNVESGSAEAAEIEVANFASHRGGSSQGGFDRRASTMRVKDQQRRDTM